MPVVLPPTTPEQRAQLWVDVEALLNPGFISHPVQIGEATFGLRSPFPQDSALATARMGLQHDTLSWQAWILAGCTWLADGQVLFEDRNAAVPLYRMYRALPRGQITRLFGCVQGLWKRYSQAISRVMTYCYEDASRSLWVGYGKSPQTSWPTYPGLQSYGMNHVQQTWVAYNQYQDLKDGQEWDWQCAKLVASTMAKGIDKIDNADRRRLQEDKERHQHALDTLYYKIAGLLEGDSTRGRLAGEAKSVEDLEEEMRKWVQGEQDSHDQSVAAYKADIAARFEAQKEAQRERTAYLESVRQQREETFESSPALVGYTAEQLSSFLPSGRGSHVRHIPDDAGVAERLYHTHVVGVPIPAKMGGQEPPSLDDELGDRVVKLRDA